MTVHTPAGEPVDLRAPSSDGPADERVLYDGFLTQPTQAAAALLLLGRVASQRFFVPPGMVAARIAASDPVITTTPTQLRFESFSACCGVALRYDVRPAGLDTPPDGLGTTSIDLTGPTRVALSAVRGLDPLRIRITDADQAAVTFTTLDQATTEPKVALPSRWVRGFAEAQAVGVGLVERALVSAAGARTFWRSLPRSGNGASVLHVVFGPRGPRLTGTPTAASVPLGGPSRLRVLEPLLPFASSVTVYGGATGVSLWQLDLTDGTLSCALSPTASRGFSGEGGLLHRLAEPHSATHADRLSAHLTEREVELVDPGALGAELGLSEPEVAAGLARLAANGRLGYDSAQHGWFHRVLPWAVDASAAGSPRLSAARRLLAEHAVTIAEDGTVHVRHGDGQHRVTGQGDHARCTCPWIARHGRSRGPCAHILAADLVRAVNRY